MSIIDKTSAAYMEAVQAETEAMEQNLIDPPDMPNGQVSTKPRKRSEEVQYFLKQNTLAVLERLHNMAMDSLYSRDESGERVRVSVQPGVQLAAATAFLDRAMGKPQVSVDLTSGDRPIIVSQEMMMPPLVQGIIDVTPQNSNNSIAPNNGVE